MVKGYIYNAGAHIFNKCYHSCDFCSESSEDNSSHKCNYCADGYLLSYAYPGNCYKLNNLQIDEEKNVNINDNENFIPFTCSKNRIFSTGECIERCPISTSFSSFEYDLYSQKYIKGDNLIPPKYLFNKKCYEICPLNSIADDSNNICKCQFAFHIENEETICYPDLNCISDYPYKNNDTNECFSSLDKCNFFFNQYCYNKCPEGKISLSSKSEEIQEYFKNNLLLLNNDLINKICICDINSNEVWNNITNDNFEYFQECLNECPEGYEPESITRQCIEKKIHSTIIKEYPKEIYKIEYPEEYYKNPDNCLSVYNNKCYPYCPDNTCATQQDPSLVYCIPIEENVKVYNNICFNNIEKLTDNIKVLSDNNTVISTESGIIMHVYSTESVNNNIENDDIKYSLVYLGECENKLREYYHLPEDIEIFIFGIDTPNKNKSFVTTIYNYEVYLENGTQLDYLIACEGTKISISSAIMDTDLIKFDDALYFSELGYDIYNDNNSFFTDVCSPASIDGNDITLEDRKKDFSFPNISLCNESCYYISVNFTTKRFACECDTVYNFSERYNNIKNSETKENISYSDYVLSLLNYKIIVCYNLFSDFKNYYYNGGFYISLGTFIFCLCGMIIFLRWGIIDLNKNIFQNIPNKMKLKLLNAKIKRRISLIFNSFNKGENNKNNPPIGRKSSRLSLNRSEKIKSTKLNNKISHIGDDKSKSTKCKKRKSKKIIDLNDKISKRHSKIINIENLNKEKNNEMNFDNNLSIILKKNRILSKSQKDSNEDNKNIKINNQIIKIKNINIKKININNGNFNSRKSKKGSKYFSLKNLDNIKNLNTNKNKKNINIFRKNTSKLKLKENLNTIDSKSNNNNINIKFLNDKILLFNDEEINTREINNIPYTQALRVDHRNYFQMFLSILFHEVKIIDIFYYKNPFNHLSLILSLYIFELCLDLTLNNLFYNDQIVSQKYNNNGSLRFLTSLSLSFMANIVASVIAFILGKLANYADVLEFIIKDSSFKRQYFLSIVKFKKYLVLKLICFYLTELILNFCICYYLIIFCTIYNKTQLSIMINYLLGMAQSLCISLGKAIITSFLRYLSLTYRWKYIYNTSKYLFEKL